MRILALETATRAGSLALFDLGTTYAAVGDRTRTHGVRLPQELFDFAENHGRRIGDMDYLCAVTGPGSFTGLRIGLATVQGMAMTSGKPVIAIPTLEAMASAWSGVHPGSTSRLVTCLDGARGDVFFSAFDLSAASAGPSRVLIPPTVASPLEAAGQVSALGEGASLVICGDCVVRYREVMSSVLHNATFDDRDLNLALGAVVLASNRTGEAAPPHALRPLYVRRPDAELARERNRAAREVPDLAVSRVITPEDLNAVAELQRRSFANAWGAEAIRWEMDNSDVARMYAARTPGGEVVAYCAYWIVFDEVHINSVAVSENLRRKGIARKLLEGVLGEAAAGGARSATLEVRQSNEAARRLYESLGFLVEGVRRAYYQDPREDALILWHRDLLKLPDRFGR